MSEAKQTIGELLKLRGKLLAILAHTVPGGHVNLKVSDLQGLKTLIGRAAEMIQKQSRRIERQELHMGRAADAINKLNGDLTAANTALTTAQANAYDQADLDAINEVLNPPTPAGSTSGTTGPTTGQVDTSTPAQ